jgi:hypothetical protein
VKHGCHAEGPGGSQRPARATLIDEYLESRGQTRHSVRDLPEPQALRLLRAASDYASLRLAEIDARAHYVDAIHRPL